MSTLRETFLEELSDIYDAEKQILKALPKMAKAARFDRLRELFEEQLLETEITPINVLGSHTHLKGGIMVGFGVQGYLFAIGALVRLQSKK
jgi:hypothetical protein